MMHLSEIMSRNVQTITPETLLTKASQIMKDNDIGFLPVLSKGRLIGIITDRDVVVRCLGEGRDAASTTAGDIMSREMAFLPAEESVGSAVHLMEARQVRRLPVVDSSQQVVGIVSLGDIAARAHEIAESGEALERICAKPALTYTVAGQKREQGQLAEPARA